MRKTKQQKIDKVIWVSIKHGDDLLKAVSDYCLENDIKAGFVSIIGALQKAKFSFYHQTEKKYYENSIGEPTEIISCFGNVSVKDGKPFVHAHISLANSKGEVFGGHLAEGCIVFSAECAIIKLEGDTLERKFDETTGLSLWDFS